jgi:hypothetical protein
MKQPEKYNVYLEKITKLKFVVLGPVTATLIIGAEMNIVNVHLKNTHHGK